MINTEYVFALMAADQARSLGDLTARFFSDKVESLWPAPSSISPSPPI
jgi:hypothetical protein